MDWKDKVRGSRRNVQSFILTYFRRKAGNIGQRKILSSEHLIFSNCGSLVRGQSQETVLDSFHKRRMSVKQLGSIQVFFYHAIDFFSLLNSVSELTIVLRVLPTALQRTFSFAHSELSLRVQKAFNCFHFLCMWIDWGAIC